MDHQQPHEPTLVEGGGGHHVPDDLVTLTGNRALAGLDAARELVRRGLAAKGAVQLGQIMTMSTRRQPRLLEGAAHFDRLSGGHPVIFGMEQLS
jgi:hypothetical protein